MQHKVYMTKKGIKDLKKAVAKLEQQKMQIQQSIRKNDHRNNRDDQFDVAERLARIETLDSEITDRQLILQSAKQLPKKQNRLSVALGSVVELIDKQGKKLRYQLVDSIEADPSKGKISASSPLGAELIGKKIRDVVKWSAGRGDRQMTLVAIS